jgi:hypothetical protein
MKVLAIAFALNPHRGGSEGGRAWNWIKQISKRHKIWVITASASKRLVGSKPICNVHIFAHYGKDKGGRGVVHC